MVIETAQLTTCLFLGFTVSFATKHKAKFILMTVSQFMVDQ